MCSSVFKYAIKGLTLIFLAITVMLFICLLWIVIDAAVVDKYTIQIDLAGIQNLQTFWREYSFLLKGFAGCATIVIAGYNLTKYVEVARIESLSALREKLNDQNKKYLHMDLVSKDDKDWEMVKQIASGAKHLKDQIKQCSDESRDSIADIYDYLGVIELGARMVKGQVISIEEFNNQFGYRVKNILNCPALREHIYRNIESYDDFRYVVDRLIEHKKIEQEYKIHKN